MDLEEDADNDDDPPLDAVDVEMEVDDGELPPEELEEDFVKDSEEETI